MYFYQVFIILCVFPECWKIIKFRVEFIGLLGPVDSTDTIGLKEIYEVHFPTTSGRTSQVYASSEWLSPKTNEDVRDDSVFRFVAPPGWRFDTAEWPGELLEYVNEDSTVLEIDGRTIRYRLVEVLGEVESLTFVEEPVEVKGGTPGFEALVLTLALLGAFLLAIGRTTSRRVRDD